jgi:transposase-like protein
MKEEKERFSPKRLFGARRLKKERKKYSAEEKVKQVRRHLIEKVPVSTVCQETGITPVMFYRWQDQLFQNGTAAFDHKGPQAPTGEQARIEKLEKKIQQKDEVLVELMAEHIALKKALGEL